MRPVCGKTEIGDLDADLPVIVPVEVDRNLLETLPDTLRLAQELFEATGGIHAAGIFDRHGSLLCSYEDIGRHNAGDKVVGHFVLKNAMPLSGPYPRRQRSGRVRVRAEGAQSLDSGDGVGWCRVESRRTDGHRRRDGALLVRRARPREPARQGLSERRTH